MKLFKLALWCAFAICVSMCLNACLDSDNDTIEPPQGKGKYADFDFKTVKEYTLSILTTNQKNEAFAGVYLEIFSSNPLDEFGVIKSSSEKTRLFKGVSNKDGEVKCKINPATIVDSIYVLTYQVGLPGITGLALTDDVIDIEIGSRSQTKSATKSQVKVTEVPAVEKEGNYYVLGSWQNNGSPNYLEADNDELDDDFLNDINASLPEGAPLTQTHPQYLTNSDDANVILIDDAEVWVTFVHEGAGWKNSLGYYTYPNDNPPQSVDEIEDLTIIYPNVSYEENTLESGNKVQLLFLDKENNEYTTLFPANRTVGWFLIANGWNRNTGSLGTGSYVHYSNINLNIEGNEDLQKHNVLLYDEDRELLVLGFEDIARNVGSCDNDFNDAVFYTTVSPFTAVQTDKYQPIASPTDTDQDGVNDNFDDFPEDPTKSFNNYYVAEGDFATLAFEDLWPSRGDYDFNDLVVAYNFNQITNSNNKLVELQAKLQVRAIGASFRNAFGFSLNIEPNLISSVTGQEITEGFLSIASNGTENGQTKASIICFDNPYSITENPGGGFGVNTIPSQPYSEPETMELIIKIAEPIDFDDFGTPPYNPFIIINKNRGSEIHMPNYAPTDLADPSIFGTYDDDGDINTGKYYISDQYLPWAINLPVNFDYPIEKRSILNAYNHFDTWASSNGEQRKDWYLDESGYRNSNNIYSK
ncbi:LruC domain-containing protein [Marinifilum sp.]|uniref:LruC domain-containing protein n=1 Tax=Marinifilum sp. TaxID=2033137 RepID=UPI003BAA1377